MTRWKFLDGRVIAEILALPPDERDQVLDDLEEVEIDPRNGRGDARSTIQPYKDDNFPGSYSISVAGGRYWLVYQVKADHPKIWLRQLVKVDDLFATLERDDDD